MKNDEIFDSVGRDGIDNKKAWDKLPTVLKYFIASHQRMIWDKVYRKVLELYGENGCKDLVKTSGFRSHATNSRVGGVNDSLHLFGLAIDFKKTGIFKNKPVPTCCQLECIDSKGCWHVQFRRGGNI